MSELRKIEEVVLRDGRSLKEVLDLHKRWLQGEEEGVRANLKNEDLHSVDLSNCDLTYIILYDCNLSHCNLSNSNLSGSDLSSDILAYSDLSYCDLSHSELYCSNLSYCNLSNSDLSNSILCHGNLSNGKLNYSNLSYCNLYGSNLYCSDLSCSILTYSDLSYSDLHNSNLYNCDLSYCNLDSGNLRNSKLNNIDLSNSNLYRCDLSNTILDNIKTNSDTLYFDLQCPKKGSFIGYKKAIGREGNKVIVKLQIDKEAKRSSATSEKCRCEKAKVLDITSIDGRVGYKEAHSSYDRDFVYRVGEFVSVEDFNNDRWKECTTGIHFFMTRKEAENYFFVLSYKNSI